MEYQGAVHVRTQRNTDHLKWFALHQLGGMSSTKLLQQHPNLKGAESTILKGIKAAAGLLQWQNVRKSEKPYR